MKNTEKEQRERPGFYAVIPAAVRYDTAVPANAKLLYGEISALIGKEGFCYAGNAYFAEVFSCSTKSVSRLLAALAAAGHIRIVQEKDRTGRVERRKLYLTVSPANLRKADKIVHTPPQNCPGGMDRNVQDTNPSITNKKNASRKGKKMCLSEAEIQELCLAWIQSYGREWDSAGKKALYAALCAFYEPRETKREMPSRTRSALRMLFNRLLDFSAGEPAVMLDMLQRATCGRWKSVYPPAGVQRPQKEEKGEEWL